MSGRGKNTSLTAASDAGRATRTVRVALGARSYDIVIGAGLATASGERIAAALPGARCVVVTDETVAQFHLGMLEQSLAGRGLHVGSLSVPAGESSKSFQRLGPLCEGLLASGIERGDVVVALGGGVIGDLAGFAASILRRGVRFVQVPTTLLAQVDSSVGGKTGINTPLGKNLIGTFHQPSLVLADIGLLDTLPERELKAGYAEIVKYGLLGDRVFFEWLERHGTDVLSGNDPEARLAAIETSVRAKAAIVSRDEMETGERALLNLGHTFGHGLEAWAGFSSRLLHGEAISIGMCLAAAFSHELGLVPPAVTRRLTGHLRHCGMPTAIADIPGNATPAAGELLHLMTQDKKVRSGKPVLILLKDIGAAFVSRDITWDRLQEFLESACRQS